MFPALFTISFIAVICATGAQENATGSAIAPNTNCAVSNLLDLLATAQQKCSLTLPFLADNNEAAKDPIADIATMAVKCLKDGFGIDVSGQITKEGVHNIFDIIEFTNPKDKSVVGPAIDSCFVNGPVGMLDLVSCIFPTISDYCKLDLAEIIGQFA